MPDRLVIGERSGSMGLWVSRPGIDVFSATPDQMLFAMESIMSLHMKGSVTLSVGSRNQTTTISHGLGYRPICMVQASVSVGMTASYLSDSVAPEQNVRSDSSNIYFTLKNNVPGESVVFNYFIFRRPVT